MEADLLKKAEQTPVNQELYMLLEFLAGQNEVMEKEIQSIESNNINIDFLKTQVEKLQTDVEQVKDKVRQNGG
jgi:predicted transcriptional regulator